jgi:SAM-dependent methyltransferase
LEVSFGSVNFFSAAAFYKNMSNFPFDIKSELSNGSPEAFEKLYIQVRRKEQRVYTDDEVRNLPQIDPAHPHFQEWLLRKRSSDRLIKYLVKKNKPLQILEVGCGNGWLASQLAKNTSGQVVGIDINKAELSQAARVFKDVSNLRFISGDIRFTQLGSDSFDIIIFAASIQYFSSLKEVIGSAFQYLRPGGEVHILDTILYKRNDVNAAKQRTNEYYSTLGFPEASSYYYHHCIDDIDVFSPQILYDPVSWRSKLNRNKMPFYWVCMKKSVMMESNS